MKKILALLLCLLMVFSLTACGDKKEPEESNPSQNIIKPEDDITEPEKTEPEETEPEETEPVVEEITTFDKFCVDNKLFALSNLTESTMIKSIAPERAIVSAISNACSPLSGCEIYNSLIFTPTFSA